MKSIQPTYDASDVTIRLVLWFAVGLWGRTIPHLADVSPLYSLSVLAPLVFPRPLAIILMLCIFFMRKFLSILSLAFF